MFSILNVGFCLLFCLSIVIVSFLLFVLFVWNEHRRYVHIPGPKRSHFFLGNFPEIDEKGKIFCEIIRDHALNYGSVFVWWYFHTPVVVISSPELIKHGLITLNLPKNPSSYNKVAFLFGRQRFLGSGLFTQLNDKKWKQRRRVLNPAFHRGYLKDLVPKFNCIADLLIEKLSKVADGETVVDMADEFQKATLDVIGKVAFSIDLNCLGDINSAVPRLLFNCLEGYERSYTQPLLQVPFYKYSYQQSVSRSVSSLREFARDCIMQRRQDIKDGKIVPNDILGMILNGAVSDKSITVEDLVDEFITFFIAGQDTTANQLSFALFETLLNEDIETRILQEVDRVQEKKEFVEFEDIAKLEYLGQTLKESLRKHPPAGQSSRITTKTEKFGHFQVPAGSHVAFSFFISHLSPEYWSDPYSFRPERFALSDEQNISNFVYSPFSCGPRICIGKAFSGFNATVLMARLFQKFKFNLRPGQKLQLEEKLTICPKGGVLCTIKERRLFNES